MKKRASRAESLKKSFFRKIVAQITKAKDEELRALIKSGAELESDEARVMSVLAADELERRERWMSGFW